MANLAQQLARLQLGAAGARHRPSRRLNDAPPISSNIASVSLQRSSVQFSLLSTLSCPPQLVLALGDGPEVPINGQTTGFLPSGPAFHVAYAYSKPLLAAVDEEGAVGIVDVALGRRKGRWVGHDNAIFDVIWTQDDARVLTAAGDLQVRIWDVETAGRSSGTEVTPVSTLTGHDMSVKCVRQAPDSAHVFASGGRDGKVLLWDTRAAGKPVATLENVHAEPMSSRASSPNVSFTSPIQKRRRRGAAPPSTSSPRSVTCVEFGATGNEIITAGAVDAVVKFWDIRRIGSSASTAGRGKKKVVAKAPVPTREISCSTREGSRRGISSLTFRTGGVGGASRLLVNVLGDSLAVIDIGQKQHDARTVLRCTGHQATSFYNRATFSPDGDFIAGASADSVVYLWDARLGASFGNSLSLTRSALGVEQCAPCFALKGHLSEVNGVAWSSHDFTQLASCSDDGTVRCWQVGGERDQRTGSRLRETTAESTKPFELQLAPTTGVSSEAATKTEWANWSEFVEQPEGFAYRVRGNEPALAPRPSSPRRRRVSTADTRKGSPQFTRRSTEPRLHPVHETPAAQQQPQQEPQGAHEAQPQEKRRIKLRRKTQKQLPAQPKRAQRTLLELWGR